MDFDDPSRSVEAAARAAARADVATLLARASGLREAIDVAERVTAHVAGAGPSPPDSDPNAPDGPRAGSRT